MTVKVCYDVKSLKNKGRVLFTKASTKHGWYPKNNLLENGGKFELVASVSYTAVWHTLYW